MAVISRSPALRLLDQRLEEVMALIGMCPPPDSDLGSRDENRRKERALCRAALVLLCSHMEGFFEDLIEDVLSFHATNRTTILMLPAALRVRQSEGHVRILAERSNDGEKRWRVIQQFRSEPLFDDTGQCMTGLLDATLHTHGFASPGSTELDGLFRSVGFAFLWTEIQSRPRGTRGDLLKGALDAVVLRRHDVAHGDAGAVITPGDLGSYVDSMRELAERTDVVVGEWLEATHACKNPWGLLL